MVLVFTVPPSDGGNFRLVPVEKYYDATWKSQCKAFEASAENIFIHHNVDVLRDTTSFPDKKMSDAGNNSYSLPQCMHTAISSAPADRAAEISPLIKVRSI